MIQDQGDGQKYVIPQKIPYPPQSVGQIKDFLNLIRKIIKQVNTDIVFHGSQIRIIDYKMNERLDGEDKRYAYNPNIHNLVRRGFSIIKVENQEPEILRQGLKKFFDIDLDYFNKNQGFKYLLHNFTFPPQLDGQIDIFVSEKANGENAQISYHQGQDAWVIASKNVTAILRTIEDLQIYKKLENSSRFDWVEVIAKEWFNKLENNPNIQALKNTLSKTTLIGEYCGHLDYQHLVQYEQAHLRFYALVSKDLNQQFADTCLEVEQAQQFIIQMGLTNVKVRKEQVKNKQELYLKLQELYKEISLSPLERDGEGTVIYFQNSITKQVISLGKLKTLEYRLKRKIREKIKNHLNQAHGNIVQSYINQSKELCKDFQDYDLGKYVQLLQTSIQYLQEVGEQKREYWKKNVKSFFLDFLNEVELFEKQKQIQQ